MPYVRVPMKLSFSLLVVVGIFIGNGAVAQSKTEIADSCLEAIEAGDLDEAKRLSTEMMDWRSLFATKTISNAEQCLQATTGEFWKYFTTKGRFLSADEARAEQDFIEGAGDRKEAQKEELKRLNCEVKLARSQVTNLEAEYENIQQARAIEALRATHDTCTQLYETDKATALLEPVCKDVFMQAGLPDTEHEFDFRKLEDARLSLALSAYKISLFGSKTSDGEGLLAECKEFASE
ncbi:MAG: hypothetical protein ACKVLA_12150 [Rhodobacterales bacterium]